MPQALKPLCLVQIWSWMNSLFSLLALWGNNSGRPKEELCLSAESRKRTYPKSYFLQKYRKNLKRLFLPKEPLSAKIASFGREKLFFWPTFGSKFLPKDCLSAEIASSCRKSLFLQKDRKAKNDRKTFCRISAEIRPKCTFGRPLGNKNWPPV